MCASFDYSYVAGVGSFDFPNLISSINPSNKFVVPYNCGIKKISLSNNQSASISGNIRIWKIESGSNYQDYLNYNLVAEENVVLSSFGVWTVEVSDLITIDSNDSLVFEFERTFGSSSLISGNVILMYDVT